MNDSPTNSHSLPFLTLQSHANLWKLYTGEEEYKSSFKDKYHRFLFSLSQNRNVFNPAVSQFLVEKGLKPFYPKNKKFAVCLTHDIDILYFTRRRLLYESSLAFRQKKPLRAARIVLNRMQKKFNPLWNFKKIISLEKKYEASSTFFFLALEKKEEDFNFDIRNLKDEFRDIIQAGHEVGLHAGHEASTDIRKMKQQKSRIEEIINMPVSGCRNHFLRFQIPGTWELLSQAGFKYDSTFGYADCVGFRNGMCHPFKPYHLITGNFIDILEIPLIIMDDTFLSYMHFDYKAALKMSKDLIDKVAELKGTITILWHNSNMLDKQLQLYEELLSYCQEREAWMTSGENIRDWWEKHQFLTYS